jgi:hypothetical protein
MGTDFRGNFTVSFGAWNEIVIPCGACNWFWAYPGLTPRAKLCRPLRGWIAADVGLIAPEVDCLFLTDGAAEFRSVDSRGAAVPT